MAFFIRPTVFSPAYCGPTACYPSRPIRRSTPSFVPFLSQVDEIVTELQREARRAARREQQRRILNPRFDVRETQEGYQVDGEVPGFEQENIEIEISDEHTLAIKGSTERKAESQPEAQPQEQVTPQAEEKTEGVTVTETEVQDNKSDTSSVKSYQPTVEDDFEDLGAETSSTLSATSSSSKGKEKAVEPEQAVATTGTVTEQPQPEQQSQEPEHHDWLNERVHGSFTRTFRFPSRIDGANVKAALKNGVLSITVPKAPVPEVRHITIQ